MAFSISPTISNDIGALQPPTNPTLAMLNEEHNDLDRAVSALLAAGDCDELLVTRLKKRKLHIKDEIARAMASLCDPRCTALG